VRRLDLLCDESVDAPIVEALRQDGFEVVYIAEVAPSGSDDEVLAIANLAENADATLYEFRMTDIGPVTDLGFVAVVFFVAMAMRQEWPAAASHRRSGSRPMRRLCSSSNDPPVAS
jgi:hypothetical protein